MTADSKPADVLARAVGISMADDAKTEKTMSDGNEPKTPKATRKTKAAKAAKPVKAAKAKKETGPKPERVFAIRITDDELDGIHKASGPRNATRFIRQIAAAFVAEDAAAFKAVIDEARQARA